ncbi:MAG: septal ring lytic transglycosylase RlpA family protein [Alphaproteobacteria bacterium]|nr:septal ring lytic transglycosylase RlpA family protein [Alphaproteobacteria bacterium]
MKKIAFVLCSVLALTACTKNGSLFHSDGSNYVSLDPTPIYKIGAPYQVNQAWYYPKEDYNYREVGIASWYGADFHNGITANGEKYDMHALTAAHKTLPLPSIVRVTNLDNGKFVDLRVNDRGPFVNNRVIDVSKAAAEYLGFVEQGIATVRVEILPDASKRLKKDILASGGKIVDGSPIDQIPAEPAPLRDTPVKTTAVPTTTVATDNSVTKVLPEGYYIQVASFAQIENAQAQSQAIESFGKSYITHINLNGQDFYRVRLGPFTTVEAAAQKLEQVRQSGFSAARVVQETNF